MMLVKIAFTFIFFFSCSTQEFRPRIETEESASLQTKVKTRLLTDKLVNGLAVEVSSNEDTIMLTGRVKSENEKRRAGLLASQIKGVKEVVNEIEVLAE